MFRPVYLFLLCLILVSCSQSKDESARSNESAMQLKYATSFTVRYLGENKLVEVLKPHPNSESYAVPETYKYLLIPKGSTAKLMDDAIPVIEVPISTIVCTSTTHIPLLDYLNETAALVGFPTVNYISSEKMRRQIDAGKVQELGVDKEMNIERLVMLKPDVVMGYTVTGDLGQFRKIQELNIPVVINSEYLEKHPLGRAEWIKFMALFFNKEQLADSIFAAIEREYLQTKALADSVERPTVVSGIVYGDAWFLPGGQNYAARLLRDAGCDYLWASDSSNGFLKLSFESVYEKANQADLWIGVGSFKTLKDIADADHRYAKFKPFTTGAVYTYDARQGATGGSEFLEIGYLRPDMILKDLVKIAHPELLKEHELYFHARLE